MAARAGCVRLNKRLAELGLCSRREADSLIERGLVLVNGVVSDVLGTKVAAHDRVELLRAGLRERERRATVLLHKPVGYVSSQPAPREIPAVRLIQRHRRCGVVPDAFADERICQWTKVGALFKPWDDDGAELSASESGSRALRPT
jgi:23S rRNA pseudouridine2604 synthase